MIINPSLPSGFVQFCDDIRHEVTGKMTLVGVYKGALVIVGQPPFTIGQLCAVVDFRFAPGSLRGKPSFRVSKSDVEQPLLIIEPDLDFESIPGIQANPLSEPGSVQFHQFVFPVQLASIPITEPCAIRLRAFVGEDEIRLGALQIVIAQPDDPI